jgi:hypothetical protein
MTDFADEWTDDATAAADVSDDALERAGVKGSAGAYTQFGLCTVSACPGNVPPEAATGRKSPDIAG